MAAEAGAGMARLGELPHGGKDGVQGTLLRLSSLGLIFTFPFPIDKMVMLSKVFVKIKQCNIFKYLSKCMKQSKYSEY